MIQQSLVEVILVIRDRKEAYRGLDNLHEKSEAALCVMEESALDQAGIAPPTWPHSDVPLPIKGQR